MNKKKKKKVWLVPDWWPSPVILATQDDLSLKPAWANSSARPYLEKNPSQKKGWWSGSRCRPWVQAPILQKKKKS
jgi:hypothetical protein